MGTSILRALVRARLPITTLALTYVVAVGVGIVQVHTGNMFALHQRDALVAGANASDPASLALQHGNALGAALLDFVRNLLLGAAPTTVGGLAIVFPYGSAIYRGWVGGIVSVDSAHLSRFATPVGATYYLVTLVLQLIPYVLAGAAGVNFGLAFLRLHPSYSDSPRWHGIPLEAVRDVARIYALVVPLFLFASLWEFLFPK